nr:MAG TPA: hypothetical protein [Bacteriophage sp.]
MCHNSVNCVVLWVGVSVLTGISTHFYNILRVV